jgi:hypothetical protein
MATVVPTIRDTRGRTRPARDLKSRGHKVSRGNLKSVSALFNFTDIKVDRIGGGFMRKMDVGKDGHDTWMEFVFPSGRTAKRVNKLQKLNLLVLDVIGRSASVGIEVKYEDGTLERHTLHQWSTFTVPPRTEFKLFSNKESGAAVYCTGDEGYLTYVEELDSGTEHVLDDMKAFREETTVNSKRPRQELNAEQRAKKFEKFKRSKNPSNNTARIDAHVLQQSSSNSAGINPQPISIETLNRLEADAEAVTVAEVGTD